MGLHPGRAAVEVVSESAVNTPPACPLASDGTSLVLLGLCMKRSGRDGFKMKEKIDISLKNPTIFTKTGCWKPLLETPSCPRMGLPGMKVAFGNCGGFWRIGTVSQHHWWSLPSCQRGLFPCCYLVFEERWLKLVIHVSQKNLRGQKSVFSSV